MCRYDGENFTVYRHDSGDPTSISDNTVRTIFEDRSGTLWVGTNSAGLNRFDRATEEFEPFRHNAERPTTLSHDSVYGIAEDAAGNLWIGTQGGLNRLDRESGSFRQFLADPDDPTSLSDNYVTTLLIDSGDRLWVGTNSGGLNLFERSTGTFTSFRHDGNDTGSLASDSVYALLEDENGKIWVGGLGVHRLDPATGTLVRLGPDAPQPVAADPVVALASNTPGTLWVGTFGGGLIELDTKTGGARNFRHQRTESHSLGDDRILSLTFDQTGTLWIGTWGGGLWRLSQPALQLAAAGKEVLPPENVENEGVTAMAGTADGGLWAGTRFGNLLRKAPGQKGFHRYLYQLGSILDLEEMDDGLIWIAGSNALTRLNRETNTSTIFKYNPADPKSLGPGYVTALLKDDQARLWVGTGEGGLQRLDDQGRVVERFVSVPGDSTSLSDDYVKALVQDHEGTIWIGTRSGGLNAFDPVTHRGRRFLPDAGDPSSISHHTVTSLFEDSRNRLWIGTGGGGLNLLRRAEDGTVTFDRISSDDGLIDDNVMAILEDDDGSLWLSTQRGLSRYNPDTRVFSQLYVGDGLPAAEFEPGAAVRTEDALYFGSIRWLAAIPAGTPFPVHRPSPVVLTSILDRDGELVGEEPPWSRQYLEIPFGSWLSISLAVLDFNPENHHSFQFRLGDEDEEWVDLGSRHEITFMDLEPGTHQFIARGQNCQGVWNTLATPLTIHVRPPWWMTLWFRLGVLVAVIGMILGFHLFRTSALRRHNLELLELHKQREQAQARLGEAYDRLRKLTRRLEAAKEEERHRIARELHDEMGPALTAVIINLQLIEGTLDREKTARWITDSIEIADRMVQQVRDLSLALRPPLLDEVGLLSAVRAYLESQAERTGLEIMIEAPETIDTLPPEIEITAFRVIQEAVSNVIRHAHAQTIEVRLKREADGVTLVIRDDGIGFEAASALAGAAPGSALGLLGMQERVRALGGSFEINSSRRQGTSVTVHLPMEVH